MAYVKTNWVDEETPVSAANMNNIENGIEQLNELSSDLYYQSGEQLKMSTGARFYAGGFITTNSTQILFSIYTPKSMKNISNITVSGAKMTIRQNGNYLLSAGTSVSLVAEKTTDNCVSFTYTASSKITDATNNDSVAITLQDATFTFS